MEELTVRQREILNFIVASIEQGRSPSVREIGCRFSISSPNGVVNHLKALEKKGIIRRSGNKARSIVLVNLIEHKRRRERVIQAAIDFCEFGSDRERSELFNAVKDYQT